MSRSVDQIASSWSPVEVKRSASWSISPRIDEDEEEDDEVLYTKPPCNEYRQIGLCNGKNTKKNHTNKVIFYCFLQVWIMWFTTQID